MREPDDDFLLPSQHKSGGLATSALNELAKRLEIVTQQEEYPLPSSWLEEHFYVPRPRDPITGEVKGKGPIILADHQRRIVNEALARDNKGLLKYTTVIYSAPKKSGKSTLSSGVALYMAEHNDYGKIYCAANDGKSSRDRLYGPIYVNFRLHRSLGGIYSGINPNKIEVTLPNYSNIEAIPCDAAGEAGAEPTGVFYCFDAETEILTRSGWKRYDEMTYEDEFATLSADGYLEWQRPINLFVDNYSGPMHLYETRRTSMMVTPNHKMYGKFYGNERSIPNLKFEKRTIEEALELGYYGYRVESLGRREVPEHEKFVTIPGTKRKPDLTIPLMPFVKLLGWFMSEGCVHKKNGNNEAILIGQDKDVNPENYQEIKDLIVELGYTPGEWGGSISFYDVRLSNYLAQFGLAHEKYVPEWVKELPDEYLEAFIDAYRKGDGYSNRGYSLSLSTNSDKLRDDLSDILIRLGYYVTTWSYQDKRWGRVVHTVNYKEYQGGERFVQTKRKFWQTVDYDGVIHCPTVPNGVVCIRRNGKIQWQGQSELWGFTTDAKRQLFTELTIPPTLHGYAIRWIESYAGFMGQSDLLWELYNLGVNEGEPHPDFLDLVDDQGRPVVWVNEDAGMFCYWDHVPRMVWQTEEYYDEERRLLSHSEFQRVHRNVWVSPVGSFIESEWWDACRDDTIPPFLSNDTPAVVGIDAATAEGGDCAAIVLVTRDPHSPLTDVAIRRARVFKGERGKINLSETIGKTLREWAKEHNIVCVVYDPFQMENMIRNFQDGKVLVTHQEIAQFNSEDEVAAYIDGERKAVQLWYKPFSQHGSRALADKRLYDMILNRQIHWTDVPGEDIIERDGADTLSQHIKQTGAKETGGKMRLEKLSREAHNDAAVALSMATHQCMYLQLDNKEFDEHRLLKKLSRDELTMAEFQRIMESRRIGQQANG